MDISPAEEYRTRISGCLSRADMKYWVGELSKLVVTLEVPFRIGFNKWGQGWALYACYAPDIEIKSGRNREALFALAAAMGQRERMRAA
jgi:hypothetical protein